jgi:signal transduction histidine kinase
MNRWFASLPIHRKLVAMALVVSTVAVTAAVAGLIVFDLLRFRTAAADGAQTLAQIIADNSSAAIVFGDTEAAQSILASLRARPVIVRACVYRADGSLFASYVQAGDRCPDAPRQMLGWRRLAVEAPVVRNGATVGNVYLERLLTDLRDRVFVTAASGLMMLLLAVGLAFALAHRLQRVISRPIVALAAAARAIGHDEQHPLPDIPAAPDETGQLVTAFGEMVQRLVSSNAALRDEVQERRRMEAEREGLLAREREASRLKDEFLAAISHELRTPLNAILGWTQVLTRGTPSPETLDKAIASLARSAQAQNRVIDDLLDVSRIIAGKMQLTFASIDLRVVVESAVDVVEPVAAAKRIALDVDIPQGPCFVQGDADRLRQVFWNLLSNAVKFTPTGGSVAVRVRAEGGVWAVSVTDTGVGVPASFIGQVFERFRQADGSLTREHGGLGLGLAIVKELTELHGGTARAASEGPGRGATFTVTLPKLGAA